MGLTYWGGEGGGVLYPEALNEWNTFKLDDSLFPSPNAPCTVVFEGAVAHVVDKKKKKGKDGALLVDRGYRAAEITAVLTLWTNEHYQAYLRRLPECHPKFSFNNRKAHKIYYPDLADLDITEVYITSIGLPVTSGDWGIRTVTWKLVEVFDGDRDNVTKKVKPTGAKVVPVKKSFQSGAAAIPDVPVEATEIGPGDE